MTLTPEQLEQMEAAAVYTLSHRIGDRPSHNILELVKAFRCLRKEYLIKNRSNAQLYAEVRQQREWLKAKDEALEYAKALLDRHLGPVESNKDRCPIEQALALGKEKE